jgi:hypothetical protein
VIEAGGQFTFLISFSNSFSFSLTTTGSIDYYIWTL